jgi:hypothetical protein
MGGNSDRKGMGEFGPVRVNAINALIGALAASLFFTGRACDQSSGAPESPSGTVYWSGDLVWGTHDLDARPPSDRAGFWHGKNFTEGVLRAGSTGILRLWFDRSTPDRDDCVAAVADGSSEVRGIEAGNYVCGRTAAGRPFRIQVFGAGSAEVSGHVTVWEQ